MNVYGKSQMNLIWTSDIWVVQGRVTSAQEWTNRTLISHELSVHFLVLPGSLLSITEITEYTYISLI